MTATSWDILRAVRQAGGDVWQVRDQLQFRAPRFLVPQIKANKAGLLALLTGPLDGNRDPPEDTSVAGEAPRQAGAPIAGAELAKRRCAPPPHVPVG
jgi:hypothetical protein